MLFSPGQAQATVPPMITVGCAGFPVPATRYFREFMFVEVQETHVSLPGPGTIRRWRREAPTGFRFALLGPREVGQEGFRDGKVIETALKSIEPVAEELEADWARVRVQPAPIEGRVYGDQGVGGSSCVSDGFDTLRHAGSLVTLYAHNSAVLVKDGDRVEAGTPIAKVGQSGRTTGPHLHFEVREKTRPRDPLPYLP